MVLAADIGNSNIVLGCFEGEKFSFTERIATNHNNTATDYMVILKYILEMNQVNVKELEGCIICSVVPSVTNALRDAMKSLTGKDAKIVGPGIRTGLVIGIDNPAQLGSDRVADAVGATHYYPCPLITIDMGTATTISVIDGSKVFRGGMIIPGLRISLESLTSRTSQLPKISLDPPGKVIGTNTVDCMKSGIIYSNAGSIEGIVKRIEKELGESCTVVATGGLARFIIPYCEREIILDEDLLLKGLMILYYKN